MSCILAIVAWVSLGLCGVLVFIHDWRRMGFEVRRSGLICGALVAVIGGPLVLATGCILVIGWLRGALWKRLNNPIVLPGYDTHDH